MTQFYYEIKEAPGFKKRRTQLLQSIETRVVRELERAVIDSSVLAQKEAPVFDKESYGEYWQWIFNRLPEYEPVPGALRESIAFVESEDKASDETGYMIGYGNISRLNSATNKFIGKLPEMVGGRNAGSKQIKMYNTSESINGRPLNNLGYWAVQEYGFKGIAPKSFMAHGKMLLTNFWNTQLKMLFKNVANDWNKGAV